MPKPSKKVIFFFSLLNILSIVFLAADENIENINLRKELAELKAVVLKLVDRIEDQEEQLADLQEKINKSEEKKSDVNTVDKNCNEDKICKEEKKSETCVVCQEPEDFPKIDSYSDTGIWNYTCDESLRIGGFIQADGRFFLHSDNGKSTFLIRRARLYAVGTLGNLFGFMLMPKWNRNRAELHYAFIETLTPPWFKLRAGLFKEPFSMEALYQDLYWDFEERSIAIQNYHHIEDMGIMAHGKIANDKIYYGIGIFNGRGREFDNNQNKEIVGRVVVNPFNDNLFKKLYVGFSGAHGRQKEDLTGRTFRTESETDFWKWAGTSNHPVKVNANRAKWGADFEWLYGPMALRSECIHVDWGNIRQDDISRRFTGWGWYSEGAYILTGEEKPRNRALVPFNDFDICRGGGAFEIVGRYEAFYASKSVLNVGLALGANEVKGFTLGTNWYLNRYVVLKLNLYELWFNRKFEVNHHWINKESVITGRVQAEF